MKFIKVTGVVIFLFLALFVKAQQDSVNSVIPREEFNYQDIKTILSGKMEIVSASRTSKNLEDLPVTIYVITRDEILRNGYVTLVDVLKNIPGVRVSQPGSGDDGELFLFRGMLGNSYCKIMLNNIPLKPSVLEGMPIGAQLPIRQAERIEIIFGPGSSVYGADATSGVINIITRQATQGAFALADLQYGQNEYYYMNYMVGGKAGRNKNILQYNFYGSKLDFGDMNIYHDKDGVYSPMNSLIDSFPVERPLDITPQLLGTYGITPSDLLMPKYEGTLHKPAFNKIPQSSYMTGLELKFRDVRFSFNQMYRRDHSSIDRTSYLYKFNDPQNYIGEKINRFNLGYSHTFGKFFCSGDISYLKYRMDNTSNRGILYSDNASEKVYLYSASDDIIVDQMISFSPFHKGWFKNLELTTGLYYQYSGNLPVTNEMSEPFNTDQYSPFSNEKLPEPPVFGSFGLNPLSYYNWGMYFQYFWSYKWFSVIGGTRYDYNQNYGESSNPRVAMLFKIKKNLSVRFSMGTAFRAPSANTMYYSIASVMKEDSTKLHYHVIPNPELKPEKSNNFEIGARYIFNNLSFDFALFSTNINKLITGNMVPIESTNFINYEDSSYMVRIYNNSDYDNTNIMGIQTTLRADNLYKPLGLKIELGVTLSQGAEFMNPTDSTDPGEVKGAFREMPKIMGQIRISLNPLRKLYIHADYLYTGEWYRKYISNPENMDTWYNKIPGYSNLDLIMSYQLWNQITIFGKVLNAFDSQYGGIDATGLDVDMRYNPQLRRNFRVGVTYSLN